MDNPRTRYYGYPSSPSAEPYQTQHQPQPHMATTTHVVVTSATLPATPVSMQCPNCHSQVVTEIAYVNGTLVWICVLVLVLFGCWLGCCLIPMCIDDLKDVEHRCPQCHAYLGTKKRM